MSPVNETMQNFSFHFWLVLLNKVSSEFILYWIQDELYLLIMIRCRWRIWRKKKRIFWHPFWVHHSVTQCQWPHGEVHTQLHKIISWAIWHLLVVVVASFRSILFYEILKRDQVLYSDEWLQQYIVAESYHHRSSNLECNKVRN